MADLMVDACGEVCPMPVIKIKKALQDMSSGQILEVLIKYSARRRISSLRDSARRGASGMGHTQRR